MRVRACVRACVRDVFAIYDKYFTQAGVTPVPLRLITRPRPLYRISVGSAVIASLGKRHKTNRILVLHQHHVITGISPIVPYIQKKIIRFHLEQN